uniref:Secreted protein n=1 Tax=Cacopsylla melanoneura TaxID=428564 RepID=A0A8D8ZD07_9HEMI
MRRHRLCTTIRWTMIMMSTTRPILAGRTKTNPVGLKKTIRGLRRTKMVGLKKTVHCLRRTSKKTKLIVGRTKTNHLGQKKTIHGLRRTTKLVGRTKTIPVGRRRIKVNPTKTSSNVIGLTTRVGLMQIMIQVGLVKGQTKVIRTNITTKIFR